MPEPQLRILLTFHAPIDVTLTQRVLALCEELTGPARRLEVRDAGHGNFAVVGIDVPSVR